MFTRKHYRAIADIIRESTGSAGGLESIDKYQLVRKLGFLFREDNANFDWNKFRTACYREE